MIGKSDEMRQKSDKFFTFFTEFFNDIQKNMPKAEKKKPAKAAMTSGAKKAGAAAMMAELAAKQAAQRK
jgi:hypothetical protein